MFPDVSKTVSGTTIFRRAAAPEFQGRVFSPRSMFHRNRLRQKRMSTHPAAFLRDGQFFTVRAGVVRRARARFVNGVPQSCQFETSLRVDAGQSQIATKRTGSKALRKLVQNDHPVELACALRLVRQKLISLGLTFVRGRKEAGSFAV